MEQTDFPAADGFAPVDPPVMLGLDPVLLIALILMLLAVAAGMYLLGRRRWDQGGGSEADRAAGEMHDAILKASTAALSAGSDDLKARAETLRSVVLECLGPVLALGNGLGEPFGQLKDALAGKGAASHGEGHVSPAVTADAGRPVTINQIYVGGSPAAAHGHGDHDAGGHGGGHHDDKRDLTAPEQVEALGVAVRKFHDHWSRRTERVRELREARQALSRRPPARLLKSSGAGRVWDRQ